MKVVAGGETIELGVTEAAPTIGIIDYSRRATDDFGVTTVVERGFARRMSVRLAVPFAQVDTLQQRLADLRATAALWVADDRFAWLSAEGYYKDFSLDLNVPPVSYCTLTVEGLAETETVTDAGDDPAPDGAASTLQLLQPVAVTTSMLTGANVPETDAPQWSSAATYALGARVIRTSTHRIYESLADENTGHNPVDPNGKWLDVGPTNRWAMFDQALGTATSATGEIAVAIEAGMVDAVALLDVEGEAVRVEAGDYDRTIVVTGGAVTFLDLPLSDAPVTIRVTGTGAVSVGSLLIGRALGLGITEASPTAAIADFSRKAVDEFGEVSVVQRAWSKRMSSRALIRTDVLDVVANRIAAVRARPSLWLGQAGLDSLTVYGFFKDFSIEVGENVSKLSLSIEGLSTAGKIAPLTMPAIVVVYRNAAAQPATPVRDTGTVPAGWAAAPQEYPIGQYRWWSQAEFRGDAQLTDWTAPVKVSGINWHDIGDPDGSLGDLKDDVEYTRISIGTVISDGWLSAAEKRSIQINKASLDADYQNALQRFGDAGSPASAADEVAAAIAAMVALDGYLGTLQPAWNDTAAATEIVAEEYRAAWGGAYAAMAAFSSALAAVAVISIGERPVGDVLSDIDAQALAVLQGIANAEVARLRDRALLFPDDGASLQTMIRRAEAQRISGDQALAETLSVIGVRSPDGSAFVFNTESVRISPTETLATRLSGIEASFEGKQASIDYLEQVVIGSEGDPYARAGLLINNNGDISGFEVFSYGTTSAFSVLGDSFQIKAGQNEEPYFYVDENGAKLRRVEVDTVKANTIVTENIVSSALAKVAIDRTTSALQIPYSQVGSLFSYYIVKERAESLLEVEAYMVAESADDLQFEVRLYLDADEIEEPTPVNLVLDNQASAGRFPVTVKGIAAGYPAGGHTITVQIYNSEPNGPLTLRSGALLKITELKKGAF